MYGNKKFSYTCCFPKKEPVFYGWYGKCKFPFGHPCPESIELSFENTYIFSVFSVLSYTSFSILCGARLEPARGARMGNDIAIFDHRGRFFFILFSFLLHIFADIFDAYFRICA